MLFSETRLILCQFNVDNSRNIVLFNIYSFLKLVATPKHKLLSEAGLNLKGKDGPKAALAIAQHAIGATKVP
ncbi:MAG TPA: hypothetical protein PKY50_20150 [Candidatus Competibacter sp.]|nr:hypothetical protein [Candidatus Competibacter sp.]